MSFRALKGQEDVDLVARLSSDDKSLCDSQQEEQRPLSSVSLRSTAQCLHVARSPLIFLLYAAGSCSLTKG